MQLADCRCNVAPRACSRAERLRGRVVDKRAENVTRPDAPRSIVLPLHALLTEFSASTTTYARNSCSGDGGGGGGGGTTTLDQAALQTRRDVKFVLPALGGLS